MNIRGSIFPAETVITDSVMQSHEETVMDTQIKILIKAIESISNSRRPYEVFRDFLELMAIRISNHVDPVHFKSREETAMQTQSKYSDNENRRIYDALLLLWNIIDKNLKCGLFKDILGRVFEELCVKVDGQDFTHDDIARLSAQLAMPKKMVLPECGYFTLNEPTCGSGSMVLAFADRLTASGMNCFTQFVTLAVDIEIRAVYMAYIQLSLYGIPGVILHGNTLTCEEYNRWYTPVYIRHDWVWREPLGFTDGRHPDDEKLKMHMEPFYAAARYVDALCRKSDQPDSKNRKKPK
jgi:hypothetical protein